MRKKLLVKIVLITGFILLLLRAMLEMLPMIIGLTSNVVSFGVFVVLLVLVIYGVVKLVGRYI